MFTLHEFDDALAHHFRDIHVERVDLMFRIEATDHDVRKNGCT